MKKWHASTIAAAVGICLGAAIGYTVALLTAGTNTPLIARPAGDSFNQLFVGMGRLETLEIAAANCDDTSDIPAVLKSEAELIPGIKGAANSQGLNPPTDVAEAILAVRNAMATKKLANQQLQSQQEARAQNLLEGDGWRKESAARIQDTVNRLDEDQCRQGSAKGERVQ